MTSDTSLTGTIGFTDSGNHDCTSNVICSSAGTMIATPDGERMVEDLRIGDAVRTAERRNVRVRWIGRQTV